MNIISHKYIFLTFSGILVAASIFAILLWGLKFGIDFTGGSLLEMEFASARPSADMVKAKFDALKLGEVNVQFVGARGIVMRFREVDESTHKKLISEIGGIAPFSNEQFTTKVSTLGAELRRRALGALIVALAGIVLYIAWSFRHVSRPVASWKYGIAAVLALCHDVIIPTGVFAVLGHFKGVEVDSLFITALLTIMGFSVHDTIVVFDRTRENLRAPRVPESFSRTVNKSVNETISRSINTSLTVLLVLGAIFFFGGETTRFFSLALIIGIIFGTYSSIFVASPLLVIWQELSIKANKK